MIIGPRRQSGQESGVFPRILALRTGRTVFFATLKPRPTTRHQRCVADGLFDRISVALASQTDEEVRHMARSTDWEIENWLRTEGLVAAQVFGTTPDKATTGGLKGLLGATL